MIEHDNIFYVKDVSQIGGVETFLYELVKKYHDLDIAVVCKSIDPEQKKRLRKYCNVYIHTNEKINCKVAVINYDTSIIDYITKDIWKENLKPNDKRGIYQTIHTDYTNKDMGTAPKDNRIKEYLAITEYILDNYKKLIGCENIQLCRNPLEIEKSNTLVIVSPTRLTTNKGGDLMLELANALDSIGQKFIWFVLTSSEYMSNPIFRNKNVVYLKPRLDTNVFYEIADWCVLPSKVEGDSYTIKEPLYNGVGVVVRELPYFKEIGIKDGVNALFINENNVLDIAKKMSTPLQFNFQPIKDGYDKLLYKGKSHYEEELKMKVEIKCINDFWDVVESKDRKVGDIWIVDRKRADYLVEERQLCEIVKIIKEEKEKATVKTKKEKAVK